VFERIKNKKRDETPQDNECGLVFGTLYKKIFVKILSLSD
jgi:hypothetical protein